MIASFDADIQKIRIDAIETQRIIDQLKRRKKALRKYIREITKQDNDVIPELHDCISQYAKELGINERYVSPNRDYIFTNDLKSLTGTILHKLVFSFKLAYIKLIREKTGIVLPIVLDSPSGREVQHSTVERMLEIIQRDYPEHQLIVASIFDYNLTNKNVIEFRDRLFSNTDVITIDKGDS